MRQVKVVQHDPKWCQAFKAESHRVAEALGKNVFSVHHIGSTAIPDIYAKPIIDLLVEVKAITEVDKQSPSMERLGYETMGEFGIPERRYFRKNNQAGIRTHHVHVFQLGSEQIERHLAFRDYMIAHPDEAQRYSDLKRKLAAVYPNDIEEYMDGKDGFIKAIDLKAAQWRSLNFI
ncbi:MAG: GrpB family protein [Cyanobacteria bacterium SBC]|nr:GrpB family protein [Cyanobacteria bacterium SBC]